MLAVINTLTHYKHTRTATHTTHSHTITVNTHRCRFVVVSVIVAVYSELSELKLKIKVDSHRTNKADKWQTDITREIYSILEWSQITYRKLKLILRCRFSCIFHSLIVLSEEECQDPTRSLQIPLVDNRIRVPLAYFCGTHLILFIFSSISRLVKKSNSEQVVSAWIAMQKKEGGKGGYGCTQT